MKRIVLIFCVVTAALTSATVAHFAWGTTSTAPQLHARPMAGTSRLTHITRNVDGGTWKISSFTNVDKKRCTEFDVPQPNGTPGAFVGCGDPAMLFSEGPLSAHVGGRQLPAQANNQRWADAWVYGIANAKVSSASLTLSDCETVAIAVQGDGYFLYIEPHNLVARGVSPQTLTGFDAAGAAVGSQDVRLAPPGVGQVLPEPTAC